MNTKRIGILLSVLLISLFIFTGCSGITNVGKDVIGAVQEETGVTPVQAQTAATPTPAPAQLPAEHKDALTIAQAQQEALADLYDRVSPSVVNIKVTIAHPDISGGEGMPGGESPFNMPGLPGIPGMPGQPGELPPMRGEGSGWVYDAEGHIVTNNHVVEDADDILVTFHDGRWAKGEVVAADPQADLAVIKVTPPKGMELKPLPLAEPDSLRVGYNVIAIGAPFGLEETLTTGVVSAIGRSLPVGLDKMGGPHYSLPDVIQTDAAINPGNSGGPLLDLTGRVVGVNFAIESPVRGSSGIGFAIPVSIVQRVVPALIENGEYHYAYLGIRGQSVTPELAEALDLPDNVLGAYVDEVMPGGPADKGGVKGGSKVVDENGIQLHKGGDIIIAIDGEPVRQFNDLVSYLVTKAAPGQEVTLTVWRDGKEVDLKVTLGERPKQPEQAPQESAGNITPKAAIAIARDAVEEQGLLKGEIKETTAMPGTYKGKDVWIVELSDGKNTVDVTIDAVTGEVLNIETQ
jgi:2-alkenal reductase